MLKYGIIDVFCVKYTFMPKNITSFWGRSPPDPSFMESKNP